MTLRGQQLGGELVDAHRPRPGETGEVGRQTRQAGIADGGNPGAIRTAEEAGEMLTGNVGNAHSAGHDEDGGPEAADGLDRSRGVGEAERQGIEAAQVAPPAQGEELDLVAPATRRGDHLGNERPGPGDQRQPFAHDAYSSLVPLRGMQSGRSLEAATNLTTSWTSGSSRNMLAASSTRSRSVPSLEKIMR